MKTPVPKFLCILLLPLFFMMCKENKVSSRPSGLKNPKPQLNLTEANRLAGLPLGCIMVEFPNRLGQTLNDSTHIKSPKVLHPAFYGCFDWHSSVHGHWSLILLLKKFPDLQQAQVIREKLSVNLSKENIASEIAYFNMEGNKTYERTYGWAWMLKLAEELHTWNDPLAQELTANLQPLTNLIIQGYLDFIPKLNYAIRVGEHSNTAFGMSLAWDYAHTSGHDKLKITIKEAVNRFYINDRDCPLNWEPSGFDFLSPCLEEANLVRKVLEPEAFKAWLKNFLPQLTNSTFDLKPGKVSDRKDGKLVHLDGLNFSRAWCLYGISEALPGYDHLKNIANAHINYSLPSIVDDNYEGTHWLGTFALNALNQAE